MPQTQIQQSFAEVADGLYQSAERLAIQLEAAAHAIVHSLTSGGKVLCAGQAEAAWLARHATHLLALGAGRERPPLAAVNVAGPGGPGMQAVPGEMDAFVRAIGHPGDIWLAFSLESDEGELAMATATARDMDLILVVMTGEAATVLGPMVRDTDVWVPVPGRNTTELFSASWLALQALMEAVDGCLLGEDA
jgi:D-sedoheptulose 7-phosphate isomerase